MLRQNDRFDLCPLSDCFFGMETPVQLNSQPLSKNANQREDFSEYVAHLQLHMTLQARNLVPTLTRPEDSREEMLQETQATFEKHVSRQSASETSQ